MSEGIDFLLPWTATGQLADNLVKELEREVTKGHALWQVNATAIAQRTDSDDVLFEIEDGGRKYAVVHLTWSGEPESDNRWPHSWIFDSLQAWADECMKQDHAEFMGGDQVSDE